MRKTYGLVLLLGWCALPAWATDGVIEINQTRAIAGGITAGDNPGFPITISQSGSYRLTSNLTVPTGVEGIRITANGVSLDLNGFTIIGPGAFPSANGIVGDDQSGIRIEHGAIVGFTSALTFLGASDYITLKELRIDADTKTSTGTKVTGVGAIIGRNKAAHAILREIQANGQIQITCPSLVLDTVGAGVVEMKVPFDGSGVGFPVACKGANVT